MDDLHFQPPHTDTLPDWLDSDLAGAAGAAVIVAQNAYRLRAVTIDQPFLVVPLSGTKRVRHRDLCIEIQPGRFMLNHEALVLEVENLPARIDEEYRAWTLPIPWRIVSMLRTLLNAHAAPYAGPQRPAIVTSGTLMPFLAPLRRILSALKEGDGDKAGDPAAKAELDLALLDLALALVRNGHGHFLHSSEPSLGARIRAIASEAPAHAWTSEEFEARLHMSGATLRRRLADEQTSLRILLREVRVHHALALLQTGSRSLKSVAHACGYKSVPSFTNHFTSHFGVAPAQVSRRGS